MALPDRPGLGDTDASTLACMSAAVVYQLFTGSVRGKQIALEYPRHVQHLLPELFQAARVSAIAYKSKMISPDLIADTEAYASTITRLSAEPYIDYGSRKIKLLRERFPFDCEAYESVPLMLRQQVQQALQVLQDAGITDKHPCGWAYGWGTPIVELNDGGLCGGPPFPLRPLCPSECAAWLRFLALTRDTFCIVHAIRAIFDPDGADRILETRTRFVDSLRSSPSALPLSVVNEWGSPFNRLSIFVNRGISFVETLRLPDRLHTISSFGSDFRQILTIPAMALRLGFPPGTVTLIKGRIPFQVSQPTQPHAFFIERHPPSAGTFEPSWDIEPARGSELRRHFVPQWGNLPSQDLIREQHAPLCIQGWVGMNSGRPEVTWAGPSPTLLIAMYVPMPLVDASALQAVYSSAALRDMPSSKWANLYLYTCTRIGCAVRVYGAEGEAMSANTKEIYLRRLGNELGWAATIGAIADAYNHRVWHQKLVTDVLTALASDDPSDPEAYSAMKPYKVLDVLFEVNTLAWWGDTANITVHGFRSLDAVVNAFTQDRVTTIDWEDALAFTERLRAGANRSELIAQAKVIAESILELLRERIDEVKARMRVLAEQLERESGGVIECARNWETY
ncbi:hypothetical protein FA13DRAFT_1805059 [Coprinellus micaceus]|uniref:Uncharacterized protein n=1 Tax=Coprinellus micaceus TaxID=71717 RepID=A0A4Y7S2N6_COPMI|nr:hypothetical protein FA13DRAFT_1805059 [Coprinellus micaceus]